MRGKNRKKWANKEKKMWKRERVRSEKYNEEWDEKLVKERHNLEIIHREEKMKKKYDL